MLALICQGRSNDEIAAVLAISSRTVETYVERMFQRFDAASRTELAARAIQEGWLEVPSRKPR